MRVYIYIYIYMFRCLQTKRAAVARLCSGIIHRVYVYIYDLLKYNENIRAGRGLVHFISSRTSRVFFYSRLDFTACGARVIIHFDRRPLAFKTYNIVLYRRLVNNRLQAFQMSFFAAATNGHALLLISS